MRITEEKKKRIIAVSLAIIGILLFVAITVVLAVKFANMGSDSEKLKEYIEKSGARGIFIAIVLQVVQVFVIVLPGEFMEIALGYAYGWLGGCILSLIGVGIGSFLIFLLVKKYGTRIIGYFFPVEKINQFKIINTDKRLRRVAFILFFIPGTPKDLLTYFFGLTRITLSEFLIITLFARIPSIVSSTIGGDFISTGKIWESVILFAVSGIAGIIGLRFYEKIMDKIKLKQTDNH